MQRYRLHYVPMILLCALAATVPCVAQASASAISGSVRDSSGLPQMGAVVQLLSPDATLIASAMTDVRGRYRLEDLRPGNYQVKGSAAMFLPAMRSNLHLPRGGRMVVNLTLATMMDATSWLPARRRGAEEPGDDWMWTLRSSANRPMLRYTDQTGVVSISSSAHDQKRAVSQGRTDVTSSDGDYSKGGVHTVFTLDRRQLDGSGVIMRANLSSPHASYPIAPSTEVTAGFERGTGLNMYSRAAITYYSHPEITNKHDLAGMQAIVLRSAERFDIGDMARIEAGSVMTEANLGGNAVAMQPFARISARPMENVIVTYGFATARGLQGADDLDQIQPSLPVAAMRNGHLALEKGSHQEVALAAHAVHGTVELTWYRDELRTPVIAGSGVLSAEQLASGAITSDASTATFRTFGPSYSSSGWSVSLVEPITTSVSLSATYEDGQALTMADRGAKANLDTTVASLKPQFARSATVAVKGNVLRTGTKLRAAYRWQSEDTLTPVNAYHSGSDRAYLGVYLRQPVRVGKLLPRGFEAILDVTNLLAEGYQPFVSCDGQTLYFAQSPRTLQAGVAFTF